MPSDREILFQGFSDEQRQDFLNLGTLKHYAPQTVIFREGEMGNNMASVEEGIISIWVQETKVNEIGSDSVPGVSALIAPHPRTASLIAETEVDLLFFRRGLVLEHLGTISPTLFDSFFVNAFRIHMNLIRQCEERIVQLNQELVSM
jgi:CRP-like cAMP-binding protein